MRLPVVRIFRRSVWAGLLLVYAAPAFADVVWPALVLEGRILTWWSIGLGLLLEFFIVRWVFNLPNRRAMIATLAANAVSTVIGLPLVPILGIGWEGVAAFTYMKILNWGTFNPITWLATYVLASLANTVIEALVYRKGFKLTVGRREFWWIFAANALSVGIAFSSLLFFPWGY